MGKLSKMLYMIDLLNTGNVYSLKELSEKLGITERMVRYYKEEICSNGIAIETFKGPNGGYFMINKVKNYTSINKYDIQLLDCVNLVLRKENYEYLDKYEEFLGKAKKMYSIYDEKSKFILNVNTNSLTEKEKYIQDTIYKNEKIEIVYNDLNNKCNKRVIHPLYMFNYKDEKYVTAFCELRNDIRHFELKRIINIK